MVVFEFIVNIIWIFIAIRFWWITCFGGQFTYESEGFFPWLLFKLGKPTPAYADRRWKREMERRIVAGEYIDEERTMYNGDVFIYKATVQDGIPSQFLNIKTNKE